MNKKLKVAACIRPKGRYQGGRPAAEAFVRAITPMAIVDAELNLLDCNSSFFKTFNSDDRGGNPARLERYIDEIGLDQVGQMLDQLSADQGVMEQKLDLMDRSYQVQIQSLTTTGMVQFLLSFLPVSPVEKHLEETRQRMRLMVEGISVGLVVVEAESYKIVDINSLALTLFGRKREEMTGKVCHQFFFHASDEDCFETPEGGLLQSGTRMLRAADGSQRPVSFSIKRKGFQNREFLLVSMTDISSQHSAEQEASHLANYDPTTDLPNRRLLQDRLQQALAWAERMQGSVALILLDLDNFKDFNDSLGHASGDRLLALIGERLRGCIRRSDTVARVGGDEFAIVISDIGSEQQVVSVAQKVLSCVGEPCSIDGRQYRLTASLGISSYPTDAKDPGNLIRLADTAMYRAKEAGRNQFQFFSPEMNADILQRLLLMNDLHQALDEEQFEVYYQPQVDMRTGGICGTEALVRWNHPQLGMIAPDQFIPLAEETGLIVPLGRWVLETACRQVLQWQQGLMIPLRLAVNLSAVQFRQTDLARQVDEILCKTKYSAVLLELELTETMLMEEVEKAQQTMEELKKMGVTLAIDDFGTGYSSLSYLKHFPIDRLKIDRSFVRDLTESPADAAIVETMIAMAGRLGHEIIAEGVEDEAQAEFLFQNGCFEIQGFFFGRPQPAAEFTQKLKDQTGKTF